jgi:hypothetical protein
VPLRNRVTPFARIEAVAARGLFMGQRGCLHDERRTLVSETWKHKGWIACVLEFRGRRRTVMAPRRYTELFFLDEAVALAAGHRPCAECRRAAFDAFVGTWAELSGEPARAPALDAALHRERVPILRGVRERARPESLPNGAFVADAEGRAYLKRDGRLLAWSHDGYTHARDCADAGELEVLTPASTLAVLGAGYQPVYHPSSDVFTRFRCGPSPASLERNKAAAVKVN